MNLLFLGAIFDGLGDHRRSSGSLKKNREKKYPSRQINFLGYPESTAFCKSIIPYDTTLVGKMNTCIVKLEK